MIEISFGDFVLLVENPNRQATQTEYRFTALAATGDKRNIYENLFLQISSSQSLTIIRTFIYLHN